MDEGVELIFFIDDYRVAGVGDDPKIGSGDVLGYLPEVERWDAIMITAYYHRGTFYGVQLFESDMWLVEIELGRF